MKLTSNEALKMLEDTRKDFENQGWIDHSICVGNSKEYPFYKKKGD